VSHPREILSQSDIENALAAPGVLYLEGQTDLMILREWARILNHPAHNFLASRLFWKETVSQLTSGAPGIQARKHYEALLQVRPGLPGLLLVDGDGRAGKAVMPTTKSGLRRRRWKRYEIESYLVHPAALECFVRQMPGEKPAEQAVEGLRRWLGEKLDPEILENPLGNHAYLNRTKARTRILPPALDAAGIFGFNYTRYHEIAAVMKQSEIHPDVVEVLDTIKEVFEL